MARISGPKLFPTAANILQPHNTFCNRKLVPQLLPRINCEEAKSVDEPHSMPGPARTRPRFPTSNILRQQYPATQRTFPSFRGLSRD